MGNWKSSESLLVMTEAVEFKREMSWPDGLLAKLEERESRMPAAAAAAAMIGEFGPPSVSASSMGEPGQGVISPMREVLSSSQWESNSARYDIIASSSS